MWSHTGFRPYECTKCKKRFFRRKSGYLHLSKSHSVYHNLSRFIISHLDSAPIVEDLQTETETTNKDQENTEILRDDVDREDEEIRQELEMSLETRIDLLRKSNETRVESKAPVKPYQCGKCGESFQRSHTIHCHVNFLKYCSLLSGPFI